MNTHASILDAVPAPPGWQSCYDHIDENGAHFVVIMPVVLFVSVETDGTDIQFRPFVITPDGTIVDYRSPSITFLCIVPPDGDAVERARAALQYRQATTRGADDDEPEVIQSDVIPLPEDPPTSTSN